EALGMTCERGELFHIKHGDTLPVIHAGRPLYKETKKHTLCNVTSQTVTTGASIAWGKKRLHAGDSAGIDSSSACACRPVALYFLKIYIALFCLLRSVLSLGTLSDEARGQYDSVQQTHSL